MSPSKQKIELHLLLPGMLGPSDGAWPEPGMVDGLSLPRLEKLLSRAVRESFSGHDLYSTLLPLFAIEDEQPPLAAISRVGDGGSVDEACWLRADPVYFKPDRDRLLLFEGRHLELTLAEAEAYADCFNRHFVDTGWKLQPMTADRWYLQVPQVPEVRLPPLADVSGRNVTPFLPRAAEKGFFYQRFNEIQMLFHHAKPAQERSAKKLLAVNGLWLWGAGVLAEMPRGDWQQVISNEPVTLGLARLAGMPTLPPATDSAQWLNSHGAVLMVDESLHQSLMTNDGMLWREAMQAFEMRLDGLLELLRNRRIETLYLYPCNGERLRLNRSLLRSFWRRIRPLTSWIRNT